MKNLLAILILLAGSIACADWRDAVNATCRIHNYASDGTMARGTGVAFSLVDGHIKVLTNAHVTQRQRSFDPYSTQHIGDPSRWRWKKGMRLQTVWWRDGYRSKVVDGTLEWYSYQHLTSRDLAIVSIPVEAFGSYVPPIIPLAPEGYDTKPGQTFVSVGCANGAWATLVCGHITLDRDAVWEFVPSPASGRSGSGIFTSDGTAIVGVVTWGYRDAHAGIAIDSSEVYRALAGQEPGTVIPDGDDTYRLQELVPVARCGTCYRFLRPGET